MTKRDRLRKKLVLMALGLLLTVAYTNCGLPFRSLEEDVGSFASRSSCELDLQAAYERSYRPFLTSTCANCHNDAGVAPLKLSSSDSLKSFNAFMGASETVVSRNALDQSHAGGVTGSQNSAAVASAHAQWSPAYDAYNVCLASGNGGQAAVMDLAEKNFPTLYFADNRIITASWDMSGADASPALNRFPGTFLIDVQVKYDTIAGVKQPTGYTLTNPRIQMATGELEVEIEGIVVRINGAKLTNLEPFLSARNIARRIDPVVFYSGSLVSPLPTLLSTDRVSVSFGYMQIRPRTDALMVPPSPMLTITQPFVRDAIVRVAVSNDTTIRRWCLTTSPVRPTSMTQCPGYIATAIDGGWTSARPTQVRLADLGTVPPDGSANQLYLWTANADLKMQASVISAAFTIDQTVPGAPTGASLQVIDTQVATVNGLSDSNEPVSWCVKESALSRDLDDANGCVFSPNKPSYVGLKGQGTRFVRFYIQDRAGNASMSSVTTVSNPFPQISFALLNGAGAQGVITAKCASCHATGMANVDKWNSTDYADSVAKKTLILNQIATPAPKHDASFVTEKEGLLLRLWLTQTTTPVQL